MSRLSISFSFLVYCHLRCSLDGNLVKSCYILLDPAYGEQPYRVKQIKVSMVTAERGNHRVTRNSSFFKRVNNDVDIDAEDSWDDNDVGGNHPVAPGQPAADAPATRQDNAVNLAVSMTMLCRIRGIIIPGNVYKCIGLSTLQCLAIMYCIVNSLTLS